MFIHPFLHPSFSHPPTCIDFSLSEYDNIDLGSVTDELGLDIKEKHKTEEKNHEEHEGDIVKRRRRESVKAKGIARVADEIRELFLKVAITDSKPLGSKNKEVRFVSLDVH